MLLIRTTGRFAGVRRLAAAAALATGLAATTVAGPPPPIAGADPLSSCTTTAGVVVAVDFSAWPAGPEGGATVVGCAPTPTTGTLTTGLAALADAGFTTAGDTHDGPAYVCRIGLADLSASQEPTASQVPCTATPPPTLSWSYWHALAGATTWTYSSLGAASYDPPPGSVDAWSFGGQSVPPSLTPSQVRAESGTVPAQLTVTTGSLPDGTAGAPYAQTLTAAGGSGGTTFTVTGGSLPTGIKLASSGALSGTPTVAGTSTFTVKAADSAGDSATAPLSITVDPGGLRITTTSLPAGMSGTAYPTTQLTATGASGTMTWKKVGTLPKGLKLGASGILSGTVDAKVAPGPTPVDVEVTVGKGKAKQVATASLSITVDPGDLRITTTSLPGGTPGVAYPATQLTATGASGTVKWKKVGALPRGLKLSASGILSGTMNANVAPGPATVGVEVTVGEGNTKQVATAAFVLEVS